MAKIEDFHVCLLGMEELNELLREIGENLDALPSGVIAAYRNLVASKPRPNLFLIQGHMSD